MQNGDALFALDRAAKFYNYVRISGWFHSPTANLVSIEVRDRNLKETLVETGLHHPGVLAFGNDRGFAVSCFMGNDGFPYDMEIAFYLDDGRTVCASLADLNREGFDRTDGSTVLSRQFKAMLQEQEGAKIVDIGGRNRSRVDRSAEYPGSQVTVFDIIEGDNVDVVGDAHEISAYFNDDHFDAFVSVSVIEHILMPWKLVLEINKVLRMGGIGLIHSHQTLGLHDAPWDFWRFSEDSWSALFNESTGFEIISSTQSLPSHVIPMFWRAEKEGGERSAGFEGSTVIVRKVSTSSLTWPVSVSDAITTTYPDNDDGFDPSLLGKNG